VRLTDHYIKNFLDYLRQINLYDNSIIILVADHGEAFFETHDDGNVLVEAHGQAPYESLIRVPLIIKLPLGASPKPAVVEEDVRLPDIPQTVLTLLGIVDNSDFRGRCIVPASSSPQRDDYPFSYRPGQHRADASERTTTNI
jgi:arylsulfatase A-like enzyme